MDMSAGAILRSKTVSVVSAGMLGAGLLGGVAFAAIPTASDTVAASVAGTSAPTATDEQAKAKLKAVLDGLVTKGVITQAQEDAIVAALEPAAQGDHPKLREFVGDVLTESVDYIGLPAEAVKQQVQAGKSLGQIADQRPGKSRDGLVADLEAKADARIKAAVDAGKITADQAAQLRTKVDAAHEHLRVEDVREDRRPHAEPLGNVLERAQRRLVAALRPPNDLLDRLGRIHGEIPHRVHPAEQRAKAHVGLPAAGASTAAWRAGFVKHHVTDLSAEAERPALELAVDDHRTADAELPGDVDHLARVRVGPLPVLGERRKVRVVLDLHRERRVAERRA